MYKESQKYINCIPLTLDFFRCVHFLTQYKLMPYTDDSFLDSMKSQCEHKYGKDEWNLAYNLATVYANLLNKNRDANKIISSSEMLNLAIESRSDQKHITSE